MSRRYCSVCHYPQSACVCASIRPLQPKTRLLVLQHPSEVGHAKNSVRLLSLVIPQTLVYVGETPEDFAELRQYLARLERPVYLVYPSEKSVQVQQAAPAADCVLLLLDGTWRKAFRLLQLNPWLQQYPALHLDLEQSSNYRIRKASRSDSLSTLEAAAHMLRALDPELEVKPLFEALDAMVDHRLAAMPPQVRARYED
ncbi:tRNA-uridine aminocarboxypropyltransferase [Shewanella salipaludis]|uniref:tRNA-uridine aminocarboxypropyltransferase n=1 Tax=Shewanella salipaludis TaxID=2723052 RepID=A0A972FSS9_9GAMM|nr:tRNA-uridine aminocarboxypropyltransferase [Shewanella salipaludis]NMH65066.1 DTW domain-containing protein [Shewanella salipaludis]